jgi:hypothetical protein
MEPLNWHTLLIIYGPLGAFAALCAAGAVKYFPKVIESHLQFTEAVKAQGERSTAAIEALSNIVASRLSGDGAEFRNHSFSTHRTNAAFLHLANAIQAGAHEVGEHMGEVVRPHVSGMKDALTKRELP